MLFILIIVLVGILVFLYCACRIAGKSDEVSKEIETTITPINSSKEMNGDE